MECIRQFIRLGIVAGVRAAIRNVRFPLCLVTVQASVWIGAAADCRAVTVVETATLGATGLTSDLGIGIYDDQFLGLRFAIPSAITTTAVGGHFGTVESVGNNQFFGAIIALTDAADFPDSSDLSTSDVLGTTLLEFPNPSAEISAPLSVTLEPGHYALIFGTGLFGATGGGGGATLNNTPLGSVSWTSYNSPPEGWRNVDLEGARFFITGIPEPSSLALLALGSLSAVRLRRRRGRAIRTREITCRIRQAIGRVCFVWSVTAALLVAPTVCCAYAAQVYGNLDWQLNGGVTFFAEEIGNQVSLVGESRSLNSIGILVKSQREDIVADLKFRFYANDGAAGAPGSLLGESRVFAGIQIPGGEYYGVGTGVFLSDIILPDVFTWTVEMTNPVPVVVGLAHAIPPARAGQSLATWSGSPSLGWTKLDQAPQFYAYIFALPEPTCGMLIATIAGCGLMGRTRCRRGPSGNLSVGLLRCCQPPSVVVTLTAMLISASQARANFSGSDDFAAPSASWSADSAGGAGLFQLHDGQLNFVTSSVSPTSNDTVQRSWIANVGEHGADWSLRMDVFLGDFSMTTDQFASVDLLVENLGDVSLDFVRIILRRDDATSRSFYADTYSNGQFAVDAVFVPTLSTRVTLGLSYDAATQTILAAYDADGAMNGYWFRPILAVPIASGATNWNMAPTDHFRARLIGQTANLNVSLGQLAIDNFLAGDNELFFVPEPSSLYLLLGMCYHRRRTTS
jgi:hypothetical protein